MSSKNAGNKRYVLHEDLLDLLIDKQTRHTLACANAHTRQQDLLLLPPTLAETSDCLLYTSPSPRDGLLSRMPSSA